MCLSCSSGALRAAPGAGKAFPGGNRPGQAPAPPLAQPSPPPCWAIQAQTPSTLGSQTPQHQSWGEPGGCTGLCTSAGTATPRHLWLRPIPQKQTGNKGGAAPERCHFNAISVCIKSSVICLRLPDSTIVCKCKPTYVNVLSRSFLISDSE